MTNKKFDKFKKKKATKKTVNKKPMLDIRHLQVTLTLEDALKFKHTAEMQGTNVQQAMVDAVNLQMKEWGLPPCGNPGTTRTKK